MCGITYYIYVYINSKWMINVYLLDYMFILRRIGPLSFNFTDFNGVSPKLASKPFSWAKVFSIFDSQFL